ncbi:sodium-dependent transporter [Flammeovirga kamogawensis]|uniref:Sodium-dependent transporter n=1 Tax=Flammeovirga kamogawensis TaxID=373891 RepID=A0ABX8GT94_9BACT|nr:sodium-dependent transporter [Flammeovirga kamogawensis]MBB6463397.1 NSS family neurotransmitter:Na+ symporter [Flammeovirga kamogawensis]QWG06633.1 sodium-dependent transporter [Flammeovirga kamogawensis]TRX68456.1 sodium-dependent transporter [Flammeovirga kamogawensis]
MAGIKNSESSRGGFSNKFGFIMAAAGSAVGLGNIWKFPFEVSDGGGGAFVVMYLLFCFMLCFPVMMAEIALGRKTNKNAVGAFAANGHKKWAGVGILAVLSGSLILSFYNVVAGWALGFAVEMFSGNFSVGSNFGEFVGNWHINLMVSTVFMFITIYIVAKGVSGGIEKASKILMPTLLFLIFGLMAYSLTQPGAIDGVKFYLIPDFSEITFKTAYGAMGQAFFSLSLGMGALITYGSYVGKKDNIVSATSMILLADVGIAFIAGLMMFAFIFSQGLQGQGGGAGLIFTVLPGAFESIGPVLGRCIGGLFFVLLSFAALTSTVSLLEVPVAYVVDEFEIRRSRAVWIVGAVIFLLGIPSMLGNGTVDFFTNFVHYHGSNITVNFMDFIEDLASDTFLPLGGFLVSVYTAYIWRGDKFKEEIESGNPGFATSFMGKYTIFALKYLAPFILGSITIITILSKFFGIHLID